MRIKNMRISGIKNLDDEYIEFTNKNIQSNKETAVKLLYGSCGSGKTAILNAIDIYIGIISKYEFLKLHNTYLKSIVSNTIIRFEIDLLINSTSFTHIVEVRLHNNEFVVYYEKVAIGKKVYYLYEKNELVLNSLIEGVYIFNNRTSVFSHYFDMMYSITNITRIDEKFRFGRFGFYSVEYTKILHSSYEILLHKELLLKFKDGKRIVDSSTEFLGDLEIYVPTLYEDLFYVGAIESFFKLMNGNIISVELYRKDLGNNECHEDILIKYKNREVFLSNESPGMQRLLELFLAINDNRTSIVLLDDFDMYLSEKQSQLLLEFLVERCKLQVIAVAQSTHLMSTVKKISKSITIMDNGVVNTWRKNGNENPAKMFLNNKFVDETIDAKKLEEFFINMRKSYHILGGLQPQNVVRK